jgi:hypothetical protein
MGLLKVFQGFGDYGLVMSRGMDLPPPKKKQLYEVV